MYRSILEILKNMLSLVTQLGDTDQIEPHNTKGCNCLSSEAKFPHFLIGVALFAVVIVLPLWFMRSGNDR